MKTKAFIILVIFEIIGAAILGYLIYKKSALSFNPVKTLLIKRYEIMYGRQSEKYLKKLIELDYPEINNVETDELKKVNILREWIAKNILWSYKTANITDSLWDKTAPEIFEILSVDKGGVENSGIASALMQLYRMYGYESFRYDAGDKKWPHSLTIVKIELNNKSYYVLQDPTFNLTYVHKNGKIYDFFDLLNSIKKGEKNDVFPKISSKYHYVICNVSECSDIIEDNNVVELKNGHIKLRVLTNFDKIINLIDYINRPYVLDTHGDKGNYKDIVKKIMEITDSKFRVD